MESIRKFKSIINNRNVKKINNVEIPTLTASQVRAKFDRIIREQHNHFKQSLITSSRKGWPVRQ